MRSIPPAFSGQHYAATKNPIYVIEIEFGMGDLVYFTKQAGVATPDGSITYQGCIEQISGTTQQIQPDEGRSTIGSISITLLDKGGEITSLLASKDANGKGIRYKRVRVYMAYEGMPWADTSTNLIQTQIVDDLSYNTGSYILKCADVQRSMRTDIFDLATTRLSLGIDDTQLKIPVYSVNGFEKLAHGSTYSDAPNATVGYIKIEDEVIRYISTQTDSLYGLCFIADQRGALGTKAVSHAVDNSSSEDQRPEITEFVYLELPAVKLIYAILTGNLYGQLGQDLPTNWHLNIGGEYVRTNDFLTIGLDLWNPATDDGFVVRFAGLDKRDAKQFIEKELCLLIAAYMPIYSSGESGLRRFTSVLHTAPYVYELNADNIVSYDPLSIDLRSVNNLLSIEWNYDFIEDKFTRQKIVRDIDSIEKYSESVSRSLQFRGLHGSRHTTTTVEGLFDRLRDRYAAPPQRTRLRCLPQTNVIEVGDIVCVKLAALRDSFTGGSLDRAMEVQQVSINWITGQVDFQLFGSTQPASPITPTAPGGNNPDPTLQTMADSYYTSEGLRLIDLAGFGLVSYTVIGGVTHITGGIGLIGNELLGAGVIYHDGDLELNAGVVLPWSKNIQLRVKGHLQINGKFDGRGRGAPGGAAASTAGSPLDGSGINRVNYGTKGYIGPTESAGGTSGYLQFGKDRWDWTSLRGWQTPGAVHSVPALTISHFLAVVMLGLPDDLQGTSGASGRNSVRFDTHDNTFYVDGGAGGAGGAGLAIIARGVSFGAAGAIDSSGGDGGIGGDSGGGLTTGGSGAGGAPGAVLFIIDGIANEVPNLSRVIAKYGISPDHADPKHQLTISPERYHPALSDEKIISIYTGFGATPPDLSGFNGASRVLFVPPINIPTQDLSQHASDALGIAASELINTPKTSAGDRSTIEVTVTPPADTTYAYSIIYIRKGGAAAWQRAGAADDELDIEVASDGATYELLAQPVSKFGIESNSGPQTTITVSNINTSYPASVANARYNHIGTLNQIYWDRIDDTRVIDYEIRNGATWETAAIVARVVMPNYNAQGNGSYWIAARIIGVNGTSVYSVSPLNVVINEAQIARNIIQTYDEAATGWAGTLSGGAIISGGTILELDHTGDIATVSDFSTLTDVGAFGETTPTGRYEFPSAHVINIGRVATCAVQIDYDITAYWTGIATPSETLAQDVGIVLQIALSQDGITWGSWQDYQIGNYTFMAIKARVNLYSNNLAATPQVSNLKFSVDVPDRVDHEIITTNAGAVVAHTYTTPFNGGPNGASTPYLTATIVNAVAGDTLRITAETAGGFDVDVFNGGRVVRTVNIRAEGY